MSLRQFVPPPYRAPWSHTPGIGGWLAGSKYSVTLFPTGFHLNYLEGLITTCRAAFSFPQLSYSEDWTVFFDTIRQRTTVQGHSKGTFFRYQLVVDEAGLSLHSLNGDLYYTNEKGEGSFILKRGERILITDKGTHAAPYNPPRLLLGVNKDPNLDRVFLKPDLLELLPHWYQFDGAFSQRKFSPSLFSSVAQAIEQNESTKVSELFLNYFRAGVVGFFIPTFLDSRHLGFEAPIIPDELPLDEVHGATHALIRSLFLRQEGSTIFLLPCLPKEMRCGHLLREKLSSSSLISIEWRKGLVRRALIHATADEELSFVLPHHLHNFTLSTPGKKGGKVISSGSPITLERGSRYFLDHFS